MIDEDVLAELVRDLAEAVVPPPEGPSRVLGRRTEMSSEVPASRTVTSTSLLRRHRVLSVAAAVVVLAAGAGIALQARRHHPVHFTAAGLSLGPTVTAGSRAGAPGASVDQAAGAPSGTGSGASSGGSSGSSGSGGGVAATALGGVTSTGTSAGAPPVPASPAATVPSVATKVVKTGQVDLTVPRGNLAPTVTALTSATAGLGGYIASTTTSEGTPIATGAMTLRIPATQFELLLAKVQSLGTATSVTTSGQDVTSQYVDLQARITALQESRARYLDILSHASTIGDILAVQQQVDGIQSQLEQLQGQLNVLTDQTSYATLTVQLTEPSPKPAPPPTRHHHPSGISIAWAHARRSFAHGAEAVISASGGFAVFAICLALLAIAARAAWTVLRRRLV